MKRITKTDVAKAFQSGDLTRDDLQSILDGWTPKKRGPKVGLIRQARILGVFEIMRQRKGETFVKSKIMSCGGLDSTPAFNRLLERAKGSWQPLPLYDLTLKNGEAYQAITLVCRAPDLYGRHYSIEIRIDDWL